MPSLPVFISQSGGAAERRRANSVYTTDISTVVLVAAPVCASGAELTGLISIYIVDFFFFFYTSTIEGLLKRAPASAKILHGQKQFPAKFEEIWLISHDVCVHLLMNNNKIYSF